jgi:hypothetical protein
MDVNRIVSELDAEIERLQQIRSALSGVPVAPAPKKRGRPKGSKNAAKTGTVAKKGGISPEGRKRIAEAMKRRWAERKKAAK